MKKIMTTTQDESVTSPAREMDGRQARATALSVAGFSAGTDAVEGREADALRIDQSLPRLLYELAVRLPAQPNIQALCVWLYEPVRQAVRLHVLMRDLPIKLRNGTGFP